MKDEKTSKKIMIEEIKEELIAYFKSGSLNLQSFFSVDESKFSNIRDILKVHFILSSEVQEFVLNLEENIRTIKNSSLLRDDLFKNQVRGAINWNKTLEHRGNTNPKDQTRFICQNIDKFYDTNENLVLKKIIEIIFNIVVRDINMDRFIGEDWYREGEHISRIISNIYLGNIYIKRIDISRVKIDDKIISKVLKSRIKIYRQAGKLLKLYKDIMDLKEEELGKLFSKTFIDVNDTDKVFEFYSIIKYLRARFPLDQVRYSLLDGKEDYLARVEGEDTYYEIYHDSTGRKDVRFIISRDEIEKSSNLYLKKKLEILDRKSEIYYELEEKSSSSYIWSGRPDLLIFKIDKKSDEILEIEIGEIKYTNRRTYMYQGLEELLEYIYFIKDRNMKYLGGIKIKGILFVDKIELKKNNFKDLKIISNYKGGSNG